MRVARRPCRGLRGSRVRALTAELTHRAERQGGACADEQTTVEVGSPEPAAVGERGREGGCAEACGDEARQEDEHRPGACTEPGEDGGSDGKYGCAGAGQEACRRRPRLAMGVGIVGDVQVGGTVVRGRKAHAAEGRVVWRPRNAAYA